MTSGKFFSSKQTEKAVEAIATLLKAEFDDLECDRNVLAAWRENPEITTDELAEQMQRTRHVVSASLVRLLSRDLIEVPAIREG
jgi:predicted transcriptional regulator